MRYLVWMILTNSHATENYSEKGNAMRQGIIHGDGCTLNCMKLRINAGDKDATNAEDIADTCGNKFVIFS